MRPLFCLPLALAIGCGSYTNLVRSAESSLADARRDLAQERRRISDLEVSKDFDEPPPAPAPVALSAGDAREIAVALDVEDKSGRLDARELPQLSSYFTHAVVEAERFLVVPRGSMLRELQLEKERSYRPCVDDACQLELGKALAARVVLHPKLIAEGDRCAFGVTLYDLRAETTLWARTLRSACTRAALFTSARAIAQSIPGPSKEDER